jgi:hypothetical protein
MIEVDIPSYILFAVFVVAESFFEAKKDLPKSATCPTVLHAPPPFTVKPLPGA